MKKQIKIDELGVRIRRIEKTSVGDIKISLEDTKEGGGKRLKEEIKSKIDSETVVQWHTPRKMIMVRDIDSTISPEEVMEGIKRELCSGEDTEAEMQVKISDKYSNKGVTYAMINLPMRDAERIERRKRIKIGWTSCRIQKLENPPKCYRCQEYGHEATQCKNIPRQDICFKCGEERHETKLCTGNAKCYAWGIQGHSARSMKCDKYKRAVEEMRGRVVFYRSTEAKTPKRGSTAN